ncbi:MAG: O-antigen ligase family protein [Clostridium sp.]|nr:O-antigen ligase family protein [Clostridium sp.]
MRKLAKKKEIGEICCQLLQEITAIYVFLMLAFYPFYYQDKYFNIGDAKWRFFLFLTCGAGVLLIAISLFYLIEKLQKCKLENAKWQVRLSVTDYFVLAYFAAVLVSVLFSPYKERVIWGYGGWYMGLIAQACFVMIYCFVSRCWKWDNSAIVCYLTAAFLVFLLAVLMRFGIDPLKLYRGLDEQHIIKFLSTIGQTTWYSSYVAILFPLGLFAFWFYDNQYVRALGGIFTAAGFMTIVTQNSDSMFAALIVLMLALFWISMESNKKFRRFLEVVIMCFGCFAFVGICQRLFEEKAVQLDSFSTFCSQSRITWMILIIVLAVYLGFRRIEKESRMDISRFKAVRVLLLAFALACVLVLIVYIYLNTMGRLPEELRSNSNYLVFNDEWGNTRGFAWRAAIGAFVKGDAARKLFGCGPDGFSLFVQEFFYEEEQKERLAQFACAHNEWLNMLVNLGIVGAAAYLGIFISAICRFFRKSRELPELTAIALSVICYMAHNFFCYQQVICTPIIFILIGAGEAMIRYGEKAT